MNKKSQTSTDTPILLSLLSFQAFIIVGLGFLNVNPESQTVDAGVWNFSVNIISNISALGWANAIIFVPLIVAIIYIVAKLIRGGG